MLSFSIPIPVMAIPFIQPYTQLFDLVDDMSFAELEEIVIPLLDIVINNSDNIKSVIKMGTQIVGDDSSYIIDTMILYFDDAISIVENLVKAVKSIRLSDVTLTFKENGE